MPSSIPIYPLRIASDVKGRAAARAKRMGMSLNAYITMAIEGLNAAVPPVRHASEYGTKTAKPLPMDDVVLQSRNSLCVCGSGKKFKRCCGA